MNMKCVGLIPSTANMYTFYCNIPFHTSYEHIWECKDSNSISWNLLFKENVIIFIEYINVLFPKRNSHANHKFHFGEIYAYHLSLHYFNSWDFIVWLCVSVCVIQNEWILLYFCLSTIWIYEPFCISWGPWYGTFLES